MKELYLALRRPSGFYGIGLFWAWIYCAWYTPSLFADSEGFAIRSNPFCEQSCIALVLTLISMLIFRRFFRRISSQALLTMSGFTLCIASIGAYLLTAYRLDFAFAIALCSLCIGIASAFMMTIWVQRCCVLNIEQCESIVPFAFLPAPLGVGVCLMLPQPANTFFMAILPLVSVFLFNNTQVQTLDVRDTAATRTFTGIQSLTPLVGRISIGALFIESILALLMGVISPGTLKNWGGAQSIFAGGSFVGIVFLVFFIKFAKSPGIFAMMRVDASLISIAALLLAVALPLSDITSAIILVAGQLGLDAFLVVNFARLGHMGWKSSLTTAIISRLPLQLGVIVGNLGAIFFGPVQIINSLSVAVIATFCTVLICFLAGRGDDSLAATYARYEQATCIENQGSLTEHSESADQPSSLLEEKCLLIANRMHLTQRETDILPYLARGMSVPFISTKLIVSRNTVDTHVRNIYRKLDIHSRDELIEFVDSY